MIPEQETRFGVYVHWPFCAAKCPYCDFNSHVRHAPVDQQRYLAAFVRELGHFRDLSGKRMVTSIFLGGGTPSLMAPATVAGILDAVRANWIVDANAEVTLEANPSSVEAGRFRGYHDAGVNRVSLGVQALNDDDLKRLGRLHDAAAARAAVTIARKNFPRISVDLIYGRPGQSLRDWRAELGEAIELAADHLSLYQLTIEPGTPFAALFAAGRLPMPDADMQADFYALTQDVTDAGGLPAYEISNHARTGAASRHNLTYWRYRDYAGVGPGAHSRLSVGGMKRAISTVLEPEDWLRSIDEQGHGIATDETLTGTQAADEMLLMGLRLSEGLDTARYRELSGKALDPARIAALSGQGMVEVLRTGKLRATEVGWPVLNSIVASLAG